MHLVSRQLSTDASRLPFIAPAALQLHSHSTTMLIKLRLADTINCGAILHHLILDATLGARENVRTIFFLIFFGLEKLWEIPHNHYEL